MKPGDKEYSYTEAGFDSFLSRSVDDLSQTNLESQGPQTTAVRYDSAQLSGFIGDSITLGSVRITKTGIIMSDGNTDVLLMGDEDG